MNASLVRARKALGLSQRAVAAAAGISPGHYARIELGQRLPSVRVEHRLAALLGRPAEALFPDLADSSSREEPAGDSADNPPAATERHPP